MNIIFTVGIFISLFQFVLLLNKKSKSLPDKILAVWMLVVGIHLTSYYLSLSGYWVKYPHLIGITAPFPLLYGPLLYLYTLYSLKNKKHLQKKDYLHFIPVIISYLYLFKFFFFYTIEQKRLVDSGEIEDFKIFSIVVVVALMISGISYSFISFNLIKKHKNLLNNNFSYTENINLNWLKYCIWGTGLIFLTVMVIVIPRDFFGIQYSFNADLIFYAMFVIAILALGYFGIRHQNLFIDNVIVEKEIPAKGEYQKSGLKVDDAITKHKALLKLMKDEKPYLKPKLTLYGLADLLDITPNHLSQIINQFENQNFNDFVNKYRIREFIERASSNNQYSLLAHAFDSGFNSKSTFNSVFKKQKGCTPSQFIAKLKK